MIKINLLGERQDKSNVYGMNMFVLAFGLVLTFGACFYAHQHIQGRLELAQDEQRELERNLRELKKITAKVEGLEQKRRTLKEKLLTIARLKSKKKGPIHILDDLNKAIPDRAWLRGIEEKDGGIEIDGTALDNQTVAVFMHSLEQSPYFKDVDLNYSTEVIRQEDNVKLKEFSLAAKLSDPLWDKEAAKELEQANKQVAGLAPDGAGEVAGLKTAVKIENDAAAKLFGSAVSAGLSVVKQDKVGGRKQQEEAVKPLKN